MNDWRATEVLIEGLADCDIAILTTGAPSREVPQVKRLRAAGVRLGAGCDGVRDTWSPLNRRDMIDRARIIAMHNNLRSDADLAFVLEICTSGGARVMGLKGYGLEVGCTADLTLLKADTLAEGAVSDAPRPLVVKAGRVTARNGTALKEAP